MRKMNTIIYIFGYLLGGLPAWHRLSCGRNCFGKMSLRSSSNVKTVAARAAPPLFFFERTDSC